MAGAVGQNLSQGFYHYVIHDLADPRVQKWPLVETPGPILTILASYLFFCIYAGPNYMKDRKPYQLKYPIMIYNFVQVILSAFMAFKGIQFIFETNFKFQCANIDYSEQGTKWAAMVWVYYMAKITELLDTVFFVLRKKNNQVTFLHLYHHTLMPALSWFGTKYTPGGQSIPEGALNSFIHVLMYSYYFIAGLGPQYHKYLWWKKYVTKFQLIQFCIVLYLNINSLFAKDCNYPKALNIFVITNCVLFLYMFSTFYIKSYISSNKNKLDKDKASAVKDKSS